MRIGLVLLLGVVQLYATDPRIGTWKEISLEENPTTKLTVTAEADGIHLVIAGDAGGVLEFTAKFDGRDYPVLHAVAVNQIALRKVNESTIEATFKRDGRATGGVRRYEASNDGKELVSTDAVTGQEDQYGIVFDRKGGPRDSTNLVVGAWIMNHAKTVQRNPEVITFTADGASGVDFSGSAGFGYNAQLDGKDYPTQQSRDDAVSLRLINARTVEETWKRDGKVTDSVRCVVSPDGQQLTMTSEGVQPDGTRFKSKEVYRKQ
jgi:hypothetical protein